MVSCKCGKEINLNRSKLGYDSCFDCSIEQKVGVVDVVYHKTGNTIEITSQETAIKVKNLSKRSSFGTMKCMTSKGTGSGLYNPKNIKHGASLSKIGSEETYERIGSDVLLLLETLGIEEALKEIKRAVLNLDIDTIQSKRLNEIVHAMVPKPEQKIELLRYHSLNIVDEKPSEIDIAFSNWKKFR